MLPRRQNRQNAPLSIVLIESYHQRPAILWPNYCHLASIEYFAPGSLLFAIHTFTFICNSNFHFYLQFKLSLLFAIHTFTFTLRLPLEAAFLSCSSYMEAPSTAELRQLSQAIVIIIININGIIIITTITIFIYGGAFYSGTQLAFFVDQAIVVIIIIIIITIVIKIIIITIIIITIILPAAVLFSDNIL